jgi:hypothetical protein
MSYPAWFSKLKVLLVVIVLGVLVWTAWSGPSGSQNSNSAGGTATYAASPLKTGNLIINGVPQAGNSSSSSSYGQSATGSAQSSTGSNVQGSVPASGSTYNTGGSSGSGQPTPAIPDYFEPYDPPPYICKSPYSGAMIACFHCGNLPTNSCNPCGGSGAQLLCYPLE